ncbi:hypothetical protein C8R47DRAFT_1214055 [Mycena vitilis]|nr:hypothetical protein C8R47DRAFT_1214055 [Mycena vitilis]
MLGTTRPIDDAVKEGARAYALEQADRERRTCVKLGKDWAPIRAKAGAYLRGEDMSVLPNVVVDVDEDQLRWAEASIGWVYCNVGYINYWDIAILTLPLVLPLTAAGE